MGKASAERRTANTTFDERALAEHGRRFLEATTDLLVIAEIDGGVLWVNEPVWERTLGIPGERMLGRGYLDLLHPEDREETLTVVGRVGGGEALSQLNRYRHADGSYRWLLWDSISDREAGLIYCLAKDITELKESQQELATSRSRMAEVQRVSHLGSWEWRPATGKVHWSDELYRIFETDPGRYEPSYEAYLALVHPDDRSSVTSAIDRLLESEEPYEMNHRVRLENGTEKVIHCRTKLDRAADGDVRVTGACQDITDATEAEAELARTASLKEATLESTADGILVVDSESRAVSWNANFVEMWHIPEQVMTSRDDDAMLESVLSQLRDPDSFLARVRELYEHADQESFDVLEFKDGRVFERYSKPQRLDGEVVGRVWSFRDVTDRLKAERENLALEARLQQSQRLESLGRLAGGIAHDFNNHLVAILNYAALAGEELPEGTAARDDLDEVIRAAERASALTRELVAFSRQEMVERRPLLLNALVADTERLLRRTIGEDVELKVELGRDMPAIEADWSQLERVLINLAVNARDAMPGGGTLRIATEAVEGEEDGEEFGDFVRLRVSDDGSGMSSEVARRAIEPFFTTKPSGEGTGLGLATVYGIVNQSGGRLEIDSTPGKGTTIRIELPASEKAPEPAPRRVATTADGTSRGTVLVVEDEAAVRRLTARLLRDAGYHTLEASRGDEAIGLLSSAEAEELRLLLTDIVMPQMSGRELAERAQALRPDLPVLFMSGYTDDVVVRHGVAADELPFLPKPFNRETLLAAVTEAIEAEPSRTR